jgi:cell division control protein 6
MLESVLCFVPPAITHLLETVTKIGNLGLQAQLVLLTISLGSKRFEVGLPLSASPTASPKTSTASKQTSSSPNPCAVGTTIGIGTGLLHTYYSAVT